MNSSPTKQAIQRAQERLAQNPVYLDTETTGMGKDATVIEIALIDSDGSTLVDSLVQPLGAIPDGAVSVHGITEEMVQDAPPWPEVWSQVQSSLQGRSVGIYNVGFDLRVIKQTHTRHWMQWRKPSGTTFFDVMEIYAQYHGQWDPRRKQFRYQSLEKACKREGIPLTNTHRARDDTLLTRALLHYLAQQS